MKPEDVTTLGDIRRQLETTAANLRALASGFYITGNREVGGILCESALSNETQAKALDTLSGKLVDQAVKGSFEASDNMVKAALATARSNP